MTTQKVCIRCKEIKLNEEYATIRSRICNTCNGDKTIRRSKPIMRNCLVCKASNKDKKFRRNQPICEECENDPNSVYEKQCSKCGLVKTNTEFIKNTNQCHDCKKAHGRNYRRTTTKAKEWVENNRERMSELQHNNYEKNKKKIRETEKTRLKEDPHFRMIKNYRVSISSLVLGKTRTNKKLDISRDNFMEWLCFCFTGDMSLENKFDTWQIDHVIPLYYYNKSPIKDSGYEDTLLHWYNIIPILKEDNQKKNKYFDTKQAILHIKNLKNFLRKNKNIHESLTNNKNYIGYKRNLQEIIDNNYLRDSSPLETPKDLVTHQVLETISENTEKDRTQTSKIKLEKTSDNTRYDRSIVDTP